MAVTAGARRITTYVGARLRVLDVNFDVLSVSADVAVDSGIDINAHEGNGCICTGQGRLEESPLNVMHGGHRSVVSGSGTFGSRKICGCGIINTHLRLCVCMVNINRAMFPSSTMRVNSHHRVVCQLFLPLATSMRMMTDAARPPLYHAD